jgi:predicted outer membrane protein
MKRTAFAAIGALLLLAAPHAGHAAPSDETFLQTAVGINLGEIQVGQLAQSKGSTAGIRDFGSMLATDHSASNREAVSLASKLHITVPTDPSPEDMRTYNQLQGKSGADFDRAFAQAMVDGHQKAIKLFTDEATSGTGDLKAYAERTLPTLQKHLATAQQLLSNPNAAVMNGGNANPAAMNGNGDAAAMNAGNGSSGAMTGGAAVAPGPAEQAAKAAGAADRTQLVEPADISANALKQATVYDADNQRVGSVADVVLARDGRIDAVVLDVGGFLGIGAKPVALAFDDLQFRRDPTNRLYVYSKFTRQQLEQAPKYDRNTYEAQRSSMRVHSAMASP